MKIVISPQNTLGGLVLLLLFTLMMGAPAFAQVSPTPTEPPEPIRTNWANSMGIVFDEYHGDMCVTLSQDQLVHIKMRVYVKDPSQSALNAIPPMYFHWQLQADGGNLDEGTMSTPFTSADFQPVPNSVPQIYEAIFSREYDCSSLLRVVAIRALVVFASSGVPS